MTTTKATKTVTAQVYDTPETVRVTIPAALCDAPCAYGAEISTGVRLCGWYRGRKWGVVKTYSIWDRGDGLNDGDLYTAYRLDCETDREEFARLSAAWYIGAMTTPPQLPTTNP